MSDAVFKLPGIKQSYFLQPFPLEEVVILGMGETAYRFMVRGFAEGMWWKRRKAQLWAINAAGCPVRADMIFCVHDKRIMDKVLNEEMKVPCAEAPQGVDPTWMQDTGCPVVTAEAVPWIPDNLVFPIELAIKVFRDTYFQTSTAYAIAFALLCQVKRIWLFGTEFNYYGHDDLSERRRHCLEFWIGQAKARGCAVELVPGSSLEQDRLLYGYSKQPILSPDFDVLGWQ